MIIETNSVGYKIWTTGNTLLTLNEEGASLWTHLAVRENSHDLYGFTSREELVFFELLITISGIGPKTALGILNVASLETLRHAIIEGNTGHLTKVSGIGKKNAEKIVLELQGKISTHDVSEGYFAKDEEDAVLALVSLGYSQKEARDALKIIDKNTQGTGDRVKQALKILNTQN